jgi:hypothetical protein
MEETDTAPSLLNDLFGKSYTELLEIDEEL